jgi:hypothetical protein
MTTWLAIHLRPSVCLEVASVSPKLRMEIKADI